MSATDPGHSAGLPIPPEPPPCVHCPHPRSSHLPPSPAGRRPRTCGRHEPGPCPCPGYESGDAA